MKFLPSTTFFTTAVVAATFSPSFAVDSTEEINPSMGIVGRGAPNYFLVWKPSQQEEELGLVLTDVEFASCATEDYELKLIVHAQPHAFFVSIPIMNDDENTQCPSLLWHADFVDPATKETLEKSVHAIEDSQVFEREMKLMEIISIGKYSLMEIGEAFHAADDGSDKPYDLVTNNCSVLIINMGKYLGIDYYSRPDIIGYVQRHRSDEEGPNMMMSRGLLPNKRGP